MTPFHHSIKQVLLPICLSTTEKFRPTEINDPQRARKVRDIQAAVSLHLKDWQAKSDFQKYMLGILAVALDMPELTQTKDGYVAPLTIVQITGNTSKHPYTLGNLYICLHGSNRVFLHEDGKTDRGSVGPTDYTVATEDQVESCLDTLNADQLRTIMTYPVFEPYIAPLFSPQTELVPADQVQPGDVVLDEGGEQES